MSRAARNRILAIGAILDTRPHVTSIWSPNKMPMRREALRNSWQTCRICFPTFSGAAAAATPKRAQNTRAEAPFHRQRGTANSSLTACCNQNWTFPVFRSLAELSASVGVHERSVRFSGQRLVCADSRRAKPSR